jgi:hypothetical protein
MHSALSANYDRALDAKYAIADGVLWSTFLHPLRSLTEDDFLSALDQVQRLAETAGTTFSSSDLVFQGHPLEPEEADVKEDGEAP